MKRIFHYPIQSSAFALAGTCALLFLHCSASVPATDFSLILSEVPEAAVLPAYEELSSKASLLEGRVSELCSNPSANTLENARIAWWEARGSLKRAEIYSFGPYKDLNIDHQLDFWPTRTNNIEAAISNNADFNESFLENLGVSAKGLPAMEYLLFNPSDPSGVLSLLTENSGERCSYLHALSRDLRANTTKLYAAWSPFEGNFSESLAQPGSASSPYPNAQNALSTLINQMIFTVELVKDTKLGKPLGKKSGGTPQPSLLESPYGHRSVQDMIDNLEGMALFYHGGTGASGISLYALLREKDASVADYLDLLIKECMRDLAEIPEPLSVSIKEKTALAEFAYERLRMLKMELTGPVSGLLGVTPFFNDNDGD